MDKEQKNKTPLETIKGKLKENFMPLGVVFGVAGCLLSHSIIGVLALEPISDVVGKGIVTAFNTAVSAVTGQSVTPALELA